MNEDPPISREDLRGLFEHLDRTSMSGYKCDHSFALAREFLKKRNLAVEPMIEWLGENGAGCDCEIMFNVAQQWDDVLGYVPPDKANPEPTSPTSWWNRLFRR